MAVTEYQRHQLFLWFEERMGQERAATMMELIPPVGASELATTRDLLDLEQRIDVKLERLRSDLQRTLGSWIFASQAAVIASIGIFTALD